MSDGRLTYIAPTDAPFYGEIEEYPWHGNE